MDPFIARHAELLVGPVRRCAQVLPVVLLFLFTPSLGRGPEMISTLLFRTWIQRVFLQVLLSPPPFQTWMSRVILVCGSMSGILWFPLKKDDVILVLFRVLFHRM